MRVLSLTLKNINSLAGEWSIDFTHRDYSDYGVFLISGPTGSGKTTILDAITLALYGRTPRILPTGDVCEVMTRGAEDCKAEVIFETPAGRFRSYWGRNRKKDGRLSPPKREFENLESRDKETRVGEIERKMKENDILDYNQFIRSVLLAQGEFKKFLESSDKEKSAILENLTDSGIYSELSSLSFAKEKEERNKLKEIENERDKIAVLAPERIAEIKDELARCDEGLKARGEQLKICQEKISWARKVEELRAVVKKLEDDKLELNRQIEEFKPSELALAAGRKALELEADYAILEKARGQLSEKRKARDEINAHLQSLSGGIKTVVLEESLAEGREKTCEKALDESRPQIAHARRLDQSIVEKGEELARARGDLKEEQIRLEKLQAELASLNRDRERGQKGLADAQAWLEANKADEWLLENRSALKAGIRNQETARAEAAQARERLAGLKKDLAGLESGIADMQKELEKKLLEKKRAQALKEDLRNQIERELGEKSLEDLKAELEDRSRELLGADRIRSLEEYRRTLLPGEPCPLCGAHDHPYLDGFPIPDADNMRVMINDLKKRIAAAEALQKRIEAQDKEIIEIGHRAALAEAEKRNLEKSRLDRISGIAEREAEAESLEKKFEAEEAAICNSLAKIGLNRSLKGLTELIDGRFERWIQKSGEKERLAKALAELQPKISAAEANLQNISASVAKAEAFEKALEENLTALQKERAGVIGGRGADEEERKLSTEFEIARKAREELNRKRGKLQGEYDKTSGRSQEAENEARQMERDVKEREADFSSRLAEKAWTEEEFLYSRLPHDKIKELENAQDSLRQRSAELAGSLAENTVRLKAEAERNLSDKNPMELAAEYEDISGQRDALQEKKAFINSRLKEDEEKREARAALEERLECQEKEWRRWEALKSLIGSEDGKKFRIFAQNITMDVLLAHANQQLLKIKDRYILQRKDNLAPDNNKSSYLDIEVVDRYLDDKKRPTSNLSGGESFIVSLALALGLAAMAGKRSALGSLFLDEGFGSLDAETLKTAVSAITNLSNEEGKLIGVISHMDALRDEKGIQTHILVEPDGKGRSVLSGSGVKSGKP